MTAVMIGVDPHKGSHTAVVIGPAQEPLGEIRVRASAAQAGKLAEWAAAWPERTWAVEGAAGLGRLLDWQLVAAGERVLDVQPKLASRARLLQAGDTNKNDPYDALSVAVAALRSRTCREVAAEDHPAVLKVRAERHRDLARLTVPGRLPAARRALRPGPRWHLQGDPLLRLPGSSARPPRPVPSKWPAPSSPLSSPGTCAAWMPSCAAPARSSPPRSRSPAPPSPRSSASARSSPAPSPATSPTCPASPAATTSPPATAPRRSRCPPGTARSTACRCAATAASTTPSTWPPSPSSGTSTAKAAQTTRRSWPRENEQRGAQVPQAQDQRRHLRPPPGRRARQAAAARAEGPGRAPGERLCLQRGRLTPRTPALRTSHSRTRHQPTTRHHYRHTVEAGLEENSANHLTPTAKRTRYGRLPGRQHGHSCRARTSILCPGKPVAVPRLLVRSGQQLTEVASRPLGLSTWAVAGASSSAAAIRLRSGRSGRRWPATAGPRHSVVGGLAGGLALAVGEVLAGDALDVRGGGKVDRG